MRNKELWCHPGENWRPIEGFPCFEVSDLGRVRSLRSNRVCTLGLHRAGYKLAVMDGKVRYAHRLVALAFLPNPTAYPVVNHKDANRANNHVTNLEWTTQKENIRLAMVVRGNWLLASVKPRQKKSIVRIDLTTHERVKFKSVYSACEALNALTVAAGGLAKPVTTLASNLSHARDNGTAYGFAWV